jgi:hypothetical protein
MKRCHNHGRRFCLWCIGATLAFPIEHFIWERLPVFRAVSHAMGL